MPRDQRLYLEDIASAAEAAERFVAGRSFEAFAADDLLRSAVLLKLIVVGEAAGHVSEELRARHAEVPWQRIRGFRNFVVHSYFGIDWRIVWEAAIQDAPALRHQVVAILEETGREGT